MPCVAAIDIGASSGRVIRVELEGLQLQEVHRFATPWYVRDGFERWDLRGMLDEIRLGLGKCGDVESAGVDTWGVDFGLLDERGAVIADPIRYRDASHGVGFAELQKRSKYEWTGIQPWPFNSAAQLLARKMRGDEELARANKIMFMPDLIVRELEKSNRVFAERSIASTSQLLGLDGTWSDLALSAAEVDRGLLPDVAFEGFRVGKCIAVGAHDTASAVAAAPMPKSSAYISSGTWSLVGVELAEPIASDEALAAGFSNERGLNDTFRFLKNVMGLWLLHGCQEARSTEECVAMAVDGKPFKARFDVNHESLLNPAHMPTAIQQIADAPLNSESDLFRCILENLAAAYAKAVDEIRRISKLNIETICIVGGGSQNSLLNQLTADASGLPVLAGPSEATALGNALSQFASLGHIAAARADGRQLVARNLPQVVYEPKERDEWKEWLSS